MYARDQKGRGADLDYRRYSGALRWAVREFASSAAAGDSLLRWNDLPDFEGAPMVVDPPARLIVLALQAGMLTDGGNRPLSLADGIYRLALKVWDLEGEGVAVQPWVAGEDGAELSMEGENAAQDGPSQADRSIPCAINGEQVLWGTRIYRVPGLGVYWGDLEALRSRIKRSDLPTFLSIAVSRFPEALILYRNYQQRAARELEAIPAIIFKEIDAYGYLHLRPVFHVDSFPPGFFEDQEILKVVELEDQEKIISVSEVLFSQDPGDLFRAMLAKAGKAVQQGVYEDRGYFILAPEAASVFIGSFMPELISAFVPIQSQVLRNYNVRIGTPRVRMHLKTGIDFLQGSAEIEMDGRSFSYGRFIEEYRKQGYVKLENGDVSYPIPREMERLQRLIALHKEDSDDVEVSFFNIPALAALVDSTDIETDGPAWDTVQGFYRGFNDLSRNPRAYPIQGGSLRPYQEYGTAWLEYVSSHSLGACLADDMGLGKTVQVIALLRKAYREKADGPSLILMPRSLLYNWTAELGRFAPELSVHVYYGTQRDTERLQDPGNQIILSSYATARLDAEDLGAVAWNYLILDESQSIKNTEAKTSKAVFSLQAAHRIALSGTPVENNLGELYSLFHFLNPGLFGKPRDFVRTYLTPIQDKRDADVLKELRLKIYPFILRRMKEDVLSELPTKTEQTVLVELDKDHLRLYHQRRAELKERIRHLMDTEGAHKAAFEILKALTELRRLAGVPETDGEYGGVSAKREYLLEAVENLVAEGHKCLIFSNYLATVDLVSQDLAGRGIGNLIMTGATVDRQSLVRRFQGDETIKAFIMTLKTGGVGLNLTAADYVFIFDPWWNRAAEAQAVDRTHRIGQERPVFSYRIIAKDTIEEKILELQERKVGLVQSILSADVDMMKALTQEDIEFLLDAAPAGARTKGARI
jgi:superfamily II DNA or RNA helicase